MRRNDKLPSSELTVICPDFIVTPYLFDDGTELDSCIVCIPYEGGYHFYIMSLLDLDDIVTWVHEFTEHTIMELCDGCDMKVDYTFGKWGLNVTPAHLISSLITHSVFVDNENKEFIKIDADTMYDYIKKGRTPFERYWKNDDEKNRGDPRMDR